MDGVKAPIVMLKPLIGTRSAAALGAASHDRVIGPVPRRNAMAKLSESIQSDSKRSSFMPASPNHSSARGAMPIFQSATFAIAARRTTTTCATSASATHPIHEVLHRKLAALENAEAALVAGSGMAAISSTMLALLGAGDHLLAQGLPNGGRHYDLLTADLPALQISTDFIDANNPRTWPKQLTERTASDLCRDRFQSADGCRRPARGGRVRSCARPGSIIDNTFARPGELSPGGRRLRSLAAQLHQIFERPLRYRGRRRDRARQPVERLRTNSTISAACSTARLLPAASRMKTLAVRVRYQKRKCAQNSALPGGPSQGPAGQLPGLESSPDHLRACELLDGSAGC